MPFSITELDFYFDLVCPFAYCASTQVENLASKHGISVNWIPVLLFGITGKKFKNDENKNKLTTRSQAPQRQLWNSVDLVWRAERLNIPLNKPKRWPINTLKPMRLLTSIKDMNLRSKCAKLLYHKFWAEDLDISNESVLLDIVKTIGITDISCVNDPLVKSQLHETTSKAISFGIFGVPTFYIGGKHKQYFFGVDRLKFVDHILTYNSVKFTPVERVINTPCVTNNVNNIEFYFDFSSPFAFLGYLRLKELEPLCKNLVYRPVYGGAIFKALGKPYAFMIGVTSKAKKQYNNMDLKRWYKSQHTNFIFNSHFPLKTIHALRVFAQDIRTIDCIFKSAWQHNLNISDTNVLKDILNRNGFNGNKLINGTKNPKIKQILIDNANFAVSKGIFGVPTYVVNSDYDRFVWGQDRLDYVKDLCYGWKPTVISKIRNKYQNKNSKL